MIFPDTSAIYALADRKDPNHGSAKERFRGLVMRARGVEAVFAFDDHFESEGFRIYAVPPPAAGS